MDDFYSLQQPTANEVPRLVSYSLGFPKLMALPPSFWHYHVRRDCCGLWMLIARFVSALTVRVTVACSQLR